jgi:hypothetical protein
LSHFVNPDKAWSSLDHMFPAADGGHSLTRVCDSVPWFRKDIQGYQFVAPRVDSYFFWTL